ncbi:hypothetical protein GCM10027277_16240 [Pseudoduganella ginsengisoli]|uniref:Uncharacterized protein n=1 Tax=Pseudoduganella ginsengisoli TaxID=1462440 RepID=A0A6L6PVH9_9BURK|nr:hypothetical protein [Pseudoduganella ginsengisoli]MTW01114.1 hypothetical protein [Pseudoduganella ginsengisoli]
MTNTVRKRRRPSATGNYPAGIFAAATIGAMLIVVQVPLSSAMFVAVLGVAIWALIACVWLLVRHSRSGGGSGSSSD